MRNFIMGCFLFALASQGAPALAQADIKLQEGAPDRYVVEKGDTLWSIAAKFLKEPWRWSEIWRLNQEQIKNPNRIYPGNVIVLDRTKRPPQLTLGQTIKLSPKALASAATDEAIRPIPANAIEPFLVRPVVVEERGLEKAPRIIAGQESRVNLGAGNIAYVSGIGKGAAILWQIFRPGRALIDPDTNRTLGYEAKYLGTARVSREGEPATIQILTSVQEISTGDRLIPAPLPVITQYIPRPPRSVIKGRIMSIYDGINTGEAGKNSVVAISKGQRDGLELGHVLAMYRAGVAIPDPESGKSRDGAPKFQLPDERYGLVFVFRVFDSVAYALVMESSRPVLTADFVQTP
ncbi:MAG: LysM domain-containing protein [Betaproteobacteria bacterium]|nr:LysM domain-containing protein [Betaproteobacteria bacterium]